MDIHTFDPETGNFEGKGQRQGLQWIVLMEAYMHVKFERVIIISSFPTIDLNKNLYMALKLEMSKVKVIKKGRNGLYMHVKFERVFISSFPTMNLNAVAKPNC